MATLLAGVMVLSTVGCGSNDTTATNTTASANAAEQASTGDVATTEAAGTEATSSDEKVTIKITWWGGQSRHDYTQKLLDTYTASHPNITFEALPSGWDGYFEKLSTQTASGSMPDIVQMDYLYISTYAKNNSVTDLQEFIDNGTIDVSNIDENLLNTGKINGKIAGLVLSNSVLSTGYNPVVFKEAGIEEPTSDWTWNDFMTTCQAIKDATGKTGNAVGPVDDTNIFNYWVRQHGEQLFSDDYKTLGYTDDQICVDFLQMWKTMMDADTMPNPDEYAQIQTLGQEAGPVVTGDAGMTFDWNNYSNRMSSVNDQLKLVTPPLADEGASKGLWVKPGMFFSIAETSKVKQEAAEFINWFVNSEEANDIIMAERGTPVSSAIREYMINSGNMTQTQVDMFEYVDNALNLCGETPAPDPVGMSEVNEAFKNAAYSAFYEQLSVEEAAAQFREEANEILARNN